MSDVEVAGFAFCLAHVPDLVEGDNCPIGDAMGFNQLRRSQLQAARPQCWMLSAPLEDGNPICNLPMGRSEISRGASLQMTFTIRKGVPRAFEGHRSSATPIC